MNTVRSSLAVLSLAGLTAALPFSATAKDSEALKVARQLNNAFVEVAETVSPSVVVISVTQKGDGEEMKRLRLDLFGSKPRAAFVVGKKGWKDAPQPPVAATVGSLLASGQAVEEGLREAVILATLIVHPGLIRGFESALERLDLSGVHDRLRAALLRHEAAGLLEFLAETMPREVDALFAQPHVTNAPPVRDRLDREKAQMCVAEDLAKLAALRGARGEVEDAVEDIGGLADEGLTWRLAQATRAVDRADRAPREDAGDLGEDRSALSKHLQNLIDGEVWVKKIR